MKLIFKITVFFLVLLFMSFFYLKFNLNKHINNFIEHCQSIIIDNQKFAKVIAATLADPERSFNYELQTYEGHWIEAHSKAHWLDDEIVGQVWSFRDVTALKLGIKHYKAGSVLRHVGFLLAAHIGWTAESKHSIYFVGQFVTSGRGKSRTEILDSIEDNHQYKNLRKKVLMK